MLCAADESGSVLAEYALVLALLSFAFMGGMLLIEQNAFSALSGPHGVQMELQHYALRDGQ